MKRKGESGTDGILLCGCGAAPGADAGVKPWFGVPGAATCPGVNENAIKVFIEKVIS
jgi:hypothetical protein